MKKSLAVVLVALILAPSALFAKNNHPMAGCGLVYQLGVRDNSSKGLQTLSATFNGFYGTQTFGITSGTSGCTEEGLLAKNEEVRTFVEVNIEHLRYDIAKGDGAYISALGALMGVSAEKMPTLMSFLHTEYSQLFPTDTTTSSEFFASLVKSMGKMPDLLS